MTLKRFWLDPYLTYLDTRITSVNGEAVTVAETIFYAFSGGQESDAGTIGGVPVLAARKDGLEIYYTLESGHGLKLGDPVRIVIDWPRRYRLMRLHFAAELVLELAYRKLSGVEKAGAHIAEDKARIDFTWGESLAPLISDLQAEAQALVEADLPIISAFSDEASERRTWEVPGFARVPCGGTHLKRTGEVGIIRLKRSNPGKGKERIDIFVE
ncbi:MAG: alanyl-tRNA editing protein [Chloroflexota bacterium]